MPPPSISSSAGDPGRSTARVDPRSLRLGADRDSAGADRRGRPRRRSSSCAGRGSSPGRASSRPGACGRSSCARRLREPEDAVGDREDRVALGSRSSYSPIRNVVASQLVRWRLRRCTKLWSSIWPGSGDLADHGAKRVDEHELGIGRFDLPEDRVAARVSRPCSSSSLPRCTKRTHVGDLGLVEERELLLVAQHLQRRLAEDREVQRRALGGGGREHDLVRERRLAAARVRRRSG